MFFIAAELELKRKERVGCSLLTISDFYSL